jgi:hypothetical protein
LRKLNPEKAAEIVRLRLMDYKPHMIAEMLGVERSTVYNYLSQVQAFADMKFIDELELELEIFRRLYLKVDPDYIISPEAEKLAQLLRKHMFLPEEFVAQAVLNAHWRGIKACRKRST